MANKGVTKQQNSEAAKQRNRDIFIPQFFFSKTRKTSPEFLFLLAKHAILYVPQAFAYSWDDINIESLSQRSPRGIGVYSGILLRWSRFFQIQLNGKKAKKKESKEKKTQRTEI